MWRRNNRARTKSAQAHVFLPVACGAGIFVTRAPSAFRLTRCRSRLPSTHKVHCAFRSAKVPPHSMHLHCRTSLPRRDIEHSSGRCGESAAAGSGGGSHAEKVARPARSHFQCPEKSFQNVVNNTSDLSRRFGASSATRVFASSKHSSLCSYSMMYIQLAERMSHSNRSPDPSKKWRLMAHSRLFPASVYQCKLARPRSQ